MSVWPVAELVPHAGDMILIDEVLEFGTDHIETRLVVRSGGLFSNADGSLPASVGIELMAQSVAAFAGRHARQDNRPAELGFLLGTRRYTCAAPAFAATWIVSRPAVHCTSAPPARCRTTTACAFSSAACKARTFSSRPG